MKQTLPFLIQSLISSETKIKAAIKELQVINDALKKLKSNQEATVQCLLEILYNPVTKQIEVLNSIYVTCDICIEENEILNKVLKQPELFGSQAATIETPIEKILQLSVQSCPSPSRAITVI